MATAFTPMLYSVEWSSEIKITLIAVISAMLAGVVALLIMELVGKRNSASNLPAGDDRVWYGSAESSPEPLPEPAPRPLRYALVLEPFACAGSRALA